MESPDPVVSVVMAVYNERPYLEGAVRSILHQTFEDFEFIIVDDGSTDGSGEVLERFAETDDRIRLTHQENQGISRSRNRGLSMAKGRYIAVMDGDDVSKPRRLGRQVQFLRTHPEVGVVGTKIKYIDADGQVTGEWPLPTDPDVTSWKLLFNACLCHPSVMVRRSLLEELGGYAEWMPVGLDYELWTRAVQVSRLANLPETLLKLRRHEGAVTVSRRTEQIRLCGRAAVSLHRALLGSEAEAQKTAFLVWMETKGIDRAVEETGVRDFAALHEYVRALYKAWTRQLRSDGSNVRVRQHALVKLDALAEQVAEQEGWARGAVHKLRARGMAPGREIVPWGLRAIRRRIAQSPIR